MSYRTAASVLGLVACLASGSAFAQDPMATFDRSGVTFRDGAQAALIGPYGHDLVFQSDTSGQDFLNLYFSASRLGSPGFANLNPALSLDSLLTRHAMVVTGVSNRGTPGAILTASAVPEPSVAVLLAVGALVIGTTLRRRG